MEQGLQKEKSFFKRQDELEELIKEIDLKVVIDTSSQMRGESNGRNDGVYAKYSAADIIQVDKIIGPGRRNNGARINVKGFAFCLT